jgi:predicted nuclease of predicted toxin-antitoxin system
VKLLFDHNLSPRLVQKLSDLYPQSEHVYNIGLDRATDDEVWHVAQDSGYVVVTRDADFSDLSTLRGFPPKIIWIRIGNCPTSRIEAALRAQEEQISAFGDDSGSGILMIL